MSGICRSLNMPSRPASGSTWTTSPGSITCEIFAGTLPFIGPVVGFAHFTPSSGTIPVSRSLLTPPAGSRPGWNPIREDWSPLSSTTAIRHGARSEGDLISASFAPQSPVRSILVTAPR